jgi:hypothetical protein
MKYVYKFTDEPRVVQGYYRLCGPALCGTKNGNLGLAAINGKKVNSHDKYSLDKKDMLPIRDILFEESESFLLRPRNSDFYLGDVEGDENFELRNKLIESPDFDPESEFPNKWEIEETVRYALSNNCYDLAAVRFQVEREWILSEEQNAKVFSEGILICPCQLGADSNTENILVSATVSISYFNLK